MEQVIQNGYEVYGVEQHLMRYFSKPELELFFDSCGLREVGNLKWLSESEQLDINSWYGVVISRLK